MTDVCIPTVFQLLDNIFYALMVAGVFYLIGYMHGREKKEKK